MASKNRKLIDYLKSDPDQLANAKIPEYLIEAKEKSDDTKPKKSAL